MDILAAAEQWDDLAARLQVFRLQLMDHRHRWGAVLRHNACA